MNNNKPPGLLGLAMIELNRQQLKKSTMAAYIMWINRFLEFAGNRLMEENNLVCEFIEQLDQAGNSISTQKSCLSALRFFYKRILDRPCVYDGVPLVDQRPRHIELIKHAEIKKLVEVQPNDLNLAMLLVYGAGLRMIEIVNLRVGNIHFRKRSISASSKLTNRRNVLLSHALVDRLKIKIAEAVKAFQKDFESNILPISDHKKLVYQNLAWLFPGRSIVSLKNISGSFRDHVCTDTFHKALRKSSKQVLGRTITTGILRTSFAYSLFIQGCSRAKIMAAMDYTNTNTATRLINSFKQIKHDCDPISPLDFYRAID